MFRASQRSLLFLLLLGALLVRAEGQEPAGKGTAKPEPAKEGAVKPEPAKDSFSTTRQAFSGASGAAFRNPEISLLDCPAELYSRRVQAPVSRTTSLSLPSGVISKF